MDFVLRDCRLQDNNNRQNSVDINPRENDQHRQLLYQWQQMQQRVLTEAKMAYEWAVSKGIAKEVARAVLPEGLTLSRLYMNGTLRSWIHYIQLRSANGTQKEHMEIAKACAVVIAEVFPLTSQVVSE
jgi:thymidylate synthase (FAD)